MIRELSSGSQQDWIKLWLKLRLNILRSLAPTIIRTDLKMIIQALIAIHHRAIQQ